MHKTDRIVIGAGVLITILAFVLAAVLAGTTVEVHPPPKIIPEPDTDSDARAATGTSQETSETKVAEAFVSPVYINLTLTWMDEADASVRHTNAPDQFGLRLEGPQGQGDEISVSANTHGQPGEVIMSYKVPREVGNWTAGTGDWEITVICGNCGNQEPMLSILGFRERTDDSNDWELAIEYTYYLTDDVGSEAE